MSQINAKDSKCWTCQFGICVKESDREKMTHPPFVSEEEPSPYGLQFEDEQAPDIEHNIDVERIKTICFWKPRDVSNSPPIVMSYVSECNRYKAL